MPPVTVLMQEILRTFGFDNIIIARDGREAFDKYCEHNPDIILTDWIMPDVDGIELVKLIRNHPKSPTPLVPIIMITGYCTKAHVEKARDSGVNEFLVKPFNSSDLFSRIEHIIKKPRDFIKAKHFFGPDRRRRVTQDFYGSKKREDDVKENDSAPVEDNPEQDFILAELKQETKKLMTD